MPTKGFSGSLPDGDGFVLWMLYRAHQETEADDPADLLQVKRIGRLRRKSPHPPEIGQNCRSQAEGDDIRQRIDLPAELAAGVGHAGDPSVQSIEDHGKADRNGGQVELTLEGAGNRVKSAEDGPDGEQGGQDVNATSKPAPSQVIPHSSSPSQ